MTGDNGMGEPVDQVRMSLLTAEMRQMLQNYLEVTIFVSYIYR